MNYGELITNLKALAFEEEDTITEYIENDVIPTSVNRAISWMCEDGMPIVKSFEISQDGTDAEYVPYDATTIVRDFLAFDTHPIRIDDGDVYRIFGDFEVENGDTLVLPGNVSGTFKVFYKAEHTKYVADGTMDNVEIPLKKRTHFLIPLLAAYFVWLDDDASKATQYYNLYEQAKANMLQDMQKPMARIAEEWGGI